VVAYFKQNNQSFLWLRWRVLLASILMLCFLLPTQCFAVTEEHAAVLETFRDIDELSDEQQLAEQQGKHEIMFIMGVLLLIGVLVTAGLGISMAVFAKQVFLAHMISAGFTVFLSLAHAVTAIVWFFPF